MLRIDYFKNGQKGLKIIISVHTFTKNKSKFLIHTVQLGIKDHFHFSFIDYFFKPQAKPPSFSPYV